MTLENWISICSTSLAGILVAIGWLWEGHNQRRAEVSRQLLEFRHSSLRSFLPVMYAIEEHGDEAFCQTNFPSQLREARVNFQLYGKPNEIKLMEDFISAINAKSADNANRCLKELVSMVKKSIRAELGLKS